MRSTQSLSEATQEPRSRMFWITLGALAVAQLFAFWLLCSHQVRKAEARDTYMTVQQLAVADCLQYLPGSTIASCSQRMDLMRASAQPATDANVAGAMPVNFNYR
ncbi:MAG: hypothetical protein ACO1PB_03425 [Ramlibacter sp.]